MTKNNDFEGFFGVFPYCPVYYITNLNELQMVLKHFFEFF